MASFYLFLAYDIFSANLIHTGRSFIHYVFSLIQQFLYCPVAIKHFDALVQAYRCLSG